MSKTQEWIRRADEGGEPASCLARAEEVARGYWDWQALAVAWMKFADAASARRCIETALELSRGYSWLSQQAASFLLNELGDREAASAALTRSEALLLSQLKAPSARHPRGVYEWVQLAEAYQQVLGQTEATRRCLAHAVTQASTLDDFLTVARYTAQLGGAVDVIRDMLERAERLARARDDLLDMRSVAEAWMRVLKDEARARALLETATAKASYVIHLTQVAVAWVRILNDEEAMRGALRRAETLVESSSNWLELANCYSHGGRSRKDHWDPEEVRRCLEASLKVEPPPWAPELEQIAAAFRDLLGESERAAKIAPPRRSMAELVPPVRRLEEWRIRDSQALLDRLRARLSPEDVLTIARADYGCGEEENRQALLEIQDTGIFLIPLDISLVEVLGLTRWSRGEELSHVRRAFACTLLGLDALFAGHQIWPSYADTLAPLLESAWALGLDEDLELFLVWLAEVIQMDEERPWILFALALSLARRAPGDPRLGRLIAELESLETPNKDLRALMDDSRGVGFMDLWSELADQLFNPARGVPPRLEQLALRIPRAQGRSGE